MSQTIDPKKIDAYEKLGAFYLGRPVDPESGDVSQTPLLYDSKDLLTHAVCIGMTGSGKTGLCIALLEEAAIDGIPALIIDVKGDLGNLLLTFPELRGEDFRPWVQKDEATRQGLDPDAFAGQQADLWKNGIAGWDQDGERIRRLRDAVEMEIYTPGSTAGTPISVLGSFAAPAPEVLEDGELLQEKIGSSVAGLLALLGIDADPVRSRETILLTSILTHAWNDGQDLDLPTVIQHIQNPPFDKVGIMPLESIFPAKDRFELAMSINNLLASPSFQSWMQGVPLDVDKLLYTADGKPRLAVLSIAHLDDTERMFFMSMLLGETLGWMRAQSGTTSLRAILYMDEIFGYLPPTGNPPSKKPMLTLLKQARAFGLGLVLATQNPVDLDYKALSNIGTWFLGRLQTERDQARVMDGLLSGESGLQKGEIEEMLAGMQKRTFLLHNVHEDAPVLFRVRWVLSYLRGPLDRNQIKMLAADGKAMAEVEAAAPRAPKRGKKPAKSAKTARPVLPPGIEERFLSPRGAEDGALYEPYLAGATTVNFVDRRKGLEAEEELLLLVPIGARGRVDWNVEETQEAYVEDDLVDDPDEGFGFASLPKAASDPKSYKKWKKELSDELYRERRWELLRSEALDLVAEPGESKRDFKIRVTDAAHEERDRETAALRKKYAKKFTTLEGRIRRAEQKIDEQEEQARSAKMQSMVNIGTSILGAFLGRKSSSLTKARSAVRGVQRSWEESQDVDRAEEDLTVLQEQFQALEAELEAEITTIAERFEQEALEFETFELKPRRQDVDVRWIGLVWMIPEEA